jgi:transcriptional antiterminator NusG
MTDPVLPPDPHATDVPDTPPPPPAPAEPPPAEEPQATAPAEPPAASPPEPPPPEPEPPPAAPAPQAAAEPAAPEAENKENKKHWYVVKVQSGREDSIKEAIERKVKIEGLEEFFGQIIIPTEPVVEMRRGKRVKKERKMFPGYIMAEVEYNDRILYLFRETSGVGDFVGGDARGNRPPPPMTPREIERMMGGPKKAAGEVKEITKPEFETGDRVKVKEGAFAGMEGEVKEILEAKGQVRVEVTIFGRPVSLEMEYWQVEQV